MVAWVSNETNAIVLVPGNGRRLVPHYRDFPIRREKNTSESVDTIGGLRLTGDRTSPSKTRSLLRHLVASKNPRPIDVIFKYFDVHAD